MEEDLCDSCGNFDWDCDCCSKGHDEEIIQNLSKGGIKNCVDYFKVKKHKFYLKGYIIK
ncbi:MAG: hypothetical protein NTU58_01455 [Candidatus Nealsonbacteria bacterium]|nr:hypothetical protein [Candidatus Nealsonbacteria bacterium]